MDRDAEPAKSATDKEIIIIAYLKMMLKSNRWEDRCGAISGALLLIEHSLNQGGLSKELSSFMWEHILDKTFPDLLVDTEFRVREQTALLLKAIVLSDQSGKGLQNFKRILDMLLKNIQLTFSRDGKGSDASGILKTEVRPLISPDSDSGKTMHDTEGWKSLETSMRNLQNLIEAIGTHLYAFDLSEVLVVIKKAIAHLNRFVREISYFVINAIFETSVGVHKTEHYDEFKKFCEELVPLTSQGLADNWSQVRFAASLCSRSYQKVVQQEDVEDDVKNHYNSILVPRMCINRYYVAEGVRVYSQETWRIVFGEKGKEVICNYADEISEFYIAQSQADNHAVREAACHCISELCSKVTLTEEAKEPFRKHI